MKANSRKWNYFTGAVLCAVVFLLMIGCQKSIDRTAANEESVAGKEPKSFKDFEQVNLVANNDEYGAAHVDPNLRNAWGIAFSGNGSVAWVNSQEGHLSALYNQEGVSIAGRPFVNIPSPSAATGGLPTGIVFGNIAGQFTIPPGPNTTSTNPAAAAFIFVGLDGVLSAWNGTYTTNAFRVFAHAGSVYTGLAIGNSAGSNFIYLANFATGHIEAYNKDWNPVAMSFTDPDLPAGYSPFNIQNVGGWLYVMYAKVDPEEHEEEAGPGLGYVDIYNTDGSLVKRFVSRGQLNAPWGVAQAPAGFFGGADSQPAILVGNFGDGHINAYSMDGDFLGQLRAHGNPIEIEGLWAIMFPPGRTDRLYFAAGPEDEVDGLFGYIKKSAE